MALELLQSVEQSVELVPDTRGSAATAKLYAPSGSELASVVALLDSLDTTVASVGSTPDVLTLSGGTIVAGREYWLRSGKGPFAKVRVSEVDGAVVTLETPPPFAPAAGDVFQGLVFTATLPSSALGTRARHYRIDWSVTVGSRTDAYRQEAHVVKMRFRPPATADDAYRVAAVHGHRAWAAGEPWATFVRLAEDASDDVRELLAANEDYPHLIGDQDRFRKAGEIALKVRLAGLGRAPPGHDPKAYAADGVATLEAAVRMAIGGVHVDRDDSLSVSATEIRGVRNIRIERY